MGTQPGWSLALYFHDRHPGPRRESLSNLRQQIGYDVEETIAGAARREQRGLKIAGRREARPIVRLPPAGHFNSAEKM
jgi:hypothetical protein